MLTARDDELDKVLGLELGADDYVTKPFSIREFRSRVRALLRRAAAPRHDPRGDEVIVNDGLSIDLARRVVEVEGRPVQLTYVEFELLRILAVESRAASTRARCCSRRSGAATSTASRARSTSTSATCARSSRRDPREPELIYTVRGVGYRFRDA